MSDNIYTAMQDCINIKKHMLMVELQMAAIYAETYKDQHMVNEWQAYMYIIIKLRKELDNMI